MMKRLRIQPDWDNFFKEPKVAKETVWVQFKSSESPAVNGKIFLKSADVPDLSEFDAQQIGINSEFTIENISKEHNSIHVSYKQSNFITTFIAPVEQYALHINTKNQKQPIHSVDVTENGLGVSSSSDGSLLVWTLSNGETRRELVGHISDVNVSKFFPSGIVVVSCGADLRIKIWSIENGKSPVMLGHLSGVTDVSIIDKGRNIVSVCRDGSCRLWDLGESKCLATFGNFGCNINSCEIKAVDVDNIGMLPMTEKPISDREIGTANKLISCACEDAYLRVIALQSRVTIFDYKCESAVNCSCFINDTTVVCGTQNGFIYVLDIQNKAAPLINFWREFRSSILSIQNFAPTNGLIISSADGSCFILNLADTNNVIELTGPDVDHVYKTSYNKSHVFTCCRDGYIRKYNLSHILGSQ